MGPRVDAMRVYRLRGADSETCPPPVRAGLLCLIVAVCRLYRISPVRRRPDKPPGSSRRAPAATNKVDATAPAWNAGIDPNVRFNQHQAVRISGPDHGAGVESDGGRAERRLDQGRSDHRRARRPEYRSQDRSRRRQAPAGKTDTQLLPRPREPALNGPHRTAELASDLVMPQALHVAEYQGDTISLWQPVDLLVDHRPQLELTGISISLRYRARPPDARRTAAEPPLPSLYSQLAAPRRRASW